MNYNFMLSNLKFLSQVTCWRWFCLVNLVVCLNGSLVSWSRKFWLLWSTYIPKISSIATSSPKMSFFLQIRIFHRYEKWFLSQWFAITFVLKAFYGVKWSKLEAVLDDLALIFEKNSLTNVWSILFSFYS